MTICPRGLFLALNLPELVAIEIPVDVGMNVSQSRENRTPYFKYAKYVMLATGSMGANREMMREYFGSDRYDDLAIMNGFPFLTGDGIRMAAEVGAQKGRMSCVLIGPHNHFKGASEVVGAVTRRPNAIKVNTNGERFCDEGLCSQSEYGWFLSASIDYQPNQMSYTLLDESILQHMIDKRREETFVVDFGAISAKEIVTFGHTEDEIDPDDVTAWILLFKKHVEMEQDAGRAKICNTLEEAAGYIGCNYEDLKETVDTYNESCRVGHDVEFMKEPFRMRRFWMSFSTIRSVIRHLREGRV